jgi:hypothetical protein
MSAAAIMAAIMRRTSTQPVEVLTEYQLWEDHATTTLNVVYGTYSSMN